MGKQIAACCFDGLYPRVINGLAHKKRPIDDIGLIFPREQLKQRSVA